jgi:catechol 2,3-dioxygenase-like lactoylglutathione lyase family enzyme
VAVDEGITHVALPVRDVDASRVFYDKYARMQTVHERTDPQTGTRVAWISDLTRPFVLVLIEVEAVDACLGGVYCHIGTAVASRAEVDARCKEARQDNRSVVGPFDAGPPVGYWAYIVDPDGHNLELSHGQEVGIAVDATGGTA